MKRVLIIGAGGFIGGHIAAESLKRGYDTWCGVRPSTSRRFLTDERLHFVELDYDTPSTMQQQLRDALPEGERWDWIVYNLGATKVMVYADFNRINYQYLKNTLSALRSAGMMPERLLYMSSLSALGPADEKSYEPYRDGMIPTPNTRYGTSKIKAETVLETTAGLNWIVFRPTGVYGPHEQDYLMMIKCIDRHWDFGVGFRKQLLTFIYVADLATAIFDALEHGKTGKKYIISEPRAYTQSEFRKIVARALGRKFVIPVRLPLWITKIASVIAEKYGVFKMQPSTLNSDKYKIMKQRNWNADPSEAKADFGFVASHSLEEGIRLTVDSYRHDLETQRAAKKAGKGNRK
jgi:nucleoside-diphosphate-sugar epimerase